MRPRSCASPISDDKLTLILRTIAADRGSGSPPFE